MILDNILFWISIYKSLVLPCFEVTIKDGIAHLSMNRPDQLNSMTRIFWKELPEIIKNIDKNSDARVIVLSGQGKHFSAGMDLGTFVPPKKSEREIDPARQREAFYHEVLELQDVDVGSPGPDEIKVTNHIMDYR